MNIPVDRISDLEPEKKLSSTDFASSVKSAIFPSGNKLKSCIESIQSSIARLDYELKNSKIVIDALITTLPSLFYIKDNSLKYVLVNNLFLENASLKRNFSFFGKSDCDFFPKNEAAANDKEDKQVLISGKAIHDREGYIPGSRKKKWGIISKFPLIDSEGNITGLLGGFTDITKRKKDEEKFRIVADYAYDWEYWQGNDNSIIYMSPSCERISGYKSDEFLSDSSLVVKIVHPDDSKLFDEHLKKVRSLNALNDSEELDFRIKKRDGSVVHISHLCRPIFNIDGKLLGRRISNRNITQRKEVEEALIKEKEKLKNVILGTNAGTWEWNVATGKTVFNERWAEIIGYTLKELEPTSIKTFEKFVHPDDLVKSDKLLQAHFNKESEFYLCDCRMKHKDGSWVLIRDRGKILEWNTEGKPLKMFGTHIAIP